MKISEWFEKKINFNSQIEKQSQIKLNSKQFCFSIGEYVTSELLSLIVLLLMSPFVFTIVSAQETSITFRLHSPDLPEDSTVYITGSVAALGNWNPAEVEMTFEGNQVWTHRIACQPGESIEYKYTRGSWEIEGADSSGHPLSNLSVTAKQDTSVNDTIHYWTSRTRREVSGQITGTVKYHPQMQGEGILPRDVIVWLPPDYDDSVDGYPVLYIQDGQNIIDPRTSAFGIDWRIDETCTRLIEQKAIPPLIVVGIYNTTDRGKEYGPGPKGSAYMKFVVEVLKPFIDKTYRTNPSRIQTFVGGSSSGGTISFILAWQYPEVFSKAMCMSPAFKYKSEDGTYDIDYVQTVRESGKPTEPLFFYIDNGGDAIDSKLQPGIDEMLSALQEKGFQPNRDYVYLHDKNGKHFEADWAKRFPEAIRLFDGINKMNRIR